MKKKIILITGSSGFIGKFFLKSALKKGYKIIDILRSKNRKNKELNVLRKKFSRSYETIFFKNNNQLEKKIKKKKIDFFINFATLYKNTHQNKDIIKFINSNIVFPSLILDVISNRVNKIINFGTMMQHVDGKNYTPKNFYASTKSAYEMIQNYFEKENKKVKIYNLKFYESFSETDNRKKLIPILFSNYKKNNVTIINSKKLLLNIIHIEDINKAIYLILEGNFISGSYCLKQKKNILISSLISKINKRLKRKIKVKYLSSKIDKITVSKLKVLKKWKPDIKIEKKIENIFYNENH